MTGVMVMESYIYMYLIFLFRDFFLRLGSAMPVVWTVPVHLAWAMIIEVFGGFWVARLVMPGM